MSLREPSVFSSSRHHLLLRARHETLFYKEEVWEVSLPDSEDLPSTATLDTDSESVFSVG